MGILQWIKPWRKIRCCSQFIKQSPQQNLWTNNEVRCPGCGRLLAYRYWLWDAWQVLVYYNTSPELRGKIMCSVLDVPKPLDETEKILEELYTMIHERDEFTEVNEEEIDLNE